MAYVMQWAFDARADAQRSAATLDQLGIAGFSA